MCGIIYMLKNKTIFLFASVIACLSIIIMPLLSVPAIMADSVSPLLTDLVFVIDNSGSMKKNDPEFITPKLVRTFMKNQSPQNQVSIVLFDGQARLLMPLTPLADHNLDETVENALSRIEYRGQYTNTPVAIERALYELRMKGRDKSQKGIILITDGIVDTGDSEKDRELTRWLTDDLVNQSREFAVRIFGVALSEAADFSLIQTLTTRTGGDYYRAYEAGQISDIFRQIQINLEPPPVKEPEQSLQKTESVAPAEIQQTQAKAQSAMESVIDTDSARAPASADKTLVVVEKGNWTVITLAIIAAIIIGIALAFFLFIQYNKRHAAIPGGQSIPVDIPEAHLEDVRNVTHAANGLIQIKKEHTKIGRGKSNDIILDQTAISGLHATIEYRNLSFYIEDQRSTNGTVLNDRKLPPNEPVRLKSGDNISFAKIPFKFFIADSKPFGDTVMLTMTALTERDSDATVIINLDDGDSNKSLISCLTTHLDQLKPLGDKYLEFINTFFAQEILEQISFAAHENLKLTNADDEQRCTPIIKDNSLYLICSLPVAISAASDWYGRKNKGFIQFIFKWLKSEQYVSSRCEQLCVITFGQDPATWVSVTIVPTHSDPDPVEIMSVEFLNDEEMASLNLGFDQHGRVI